MWQKHHHNQKGDTAQLATSTFENKNQSATTMEATNQQITHLHAPHCHHDRFTMD